MSTSISAPPSPSLRTAQAYLQGVQDTGILGTGPAESTAQRPNVFKAFLHTLPFPMLCIQAVWSSLIVVVLYLLNSSTHPNTLDDAIWTSRLNVPPLVASAMSWALFVLLAFFIREATARYRSAATAVRDVAMLLRYTLRNFLYNYPAGTWHPGDVDRIVRHFVAFPIALKMTLRGERDRSQLEHILHESDVEDVVNADAMHTQCMRVVRAYSFAVVDEKPTHAFACVDAKKNPAGKLATRFMIVGLDEIDLAAQKAVAISEYRSSIAYVNHLNVFLYIWIFFLPLVLVRMSGWYVTFPFYSSFYFLWRKLKVSTKRKWKAILSISIRY